jgi:UDP-N-acetylmuramate dehydrogenase
VNRSIDAGVLASAIGERVAASIVHRDHPVGGMTTYRVGGAADVFVEVGSLGDLVAVASVVAALRPDVVVLGRGSNLLIADNGVRGLVVHLGEAFDSIDVQASRVRLGGAASLPTAARRLAGVGLTGFEWAVGVPGSAGGAVRMNAGGHGSDMAASVRCARIVDLHLGEEAPVSVEDLGLSYRSSRVQAHQVVTEVTLDLEPGDAARSEAELREIVRWRRTHQPGGQNAGSVFTNPVGDSAGRLIDAAGLRGHRHGSAHVSTKHANFIQADPGGAADDIVALMAVIVQRVHDHAGIWLHPETALVGFDDEALSSLHPEATSAPCDTVTQEDAL